MRKIHCWLGTMKFLEKKRSKFILALQLKFGMSASGIYDKIKKNNWLPYQKDIVDEVINEGSWEKL